MFQVYQVYRRSGACLAEQGDIDLREPLEDALEAYAGTLLVISHDRDLQDRLAERLLVVQEGQVQAYPGSYSEWAGQFGFTAYGA